MLVNQYQEQKLDHIFASGVTTMVMSFALFINIPCANLIAPSLNLLTGRIQEISKPIERIDSLLKLEGKNPF